MQRELDLAGIGPQWRKTPVTGELLERPVEKLHIDAGRPFLLVARGEMLPDALEIDVDLCFHVTFVMVANVDAAAPRQKIGVIGDIGDEIEHLLRGMTDQHSFLDICHRGRST